MRQTVAFLLVAVLLVALTAPAYAGGATDIALGLAAFAVFNQLFAPALYPRPVYAAPVIVSQPAVIYRVAPVYAYPSGYSVYPNQYAVVQPPAPMPTVVQYPHGRYELRGDGITVAYHWVWIPNPPPPPPPPISSTPPSYSAAPSPR